MTKKTTLLNQTYTYLRPQKDRTPEPTSIEGTVLAGLRKVKRGSLDEVHTAALKLGLRKATDQDTREQTRVWLRRLEKFGVVKISRNDAAKKSAAPKAKKATKKNGSFVGKSFDAPGKKSFKVVATQ